MSGATLIATAGSLGFWFSENRRLFFLRIKEIFQRRDWTAYNTAGISYNEPHKSTAIMARFPVQ
jgi:hypothetical protein